MLQGRPASSSARARVQAEFFQLVGIISDACKFADLMKLEFVLRRAAALALARVFVRSRKASFAALGRLLLALRRGLVLRGPPTLAFGQRAFEPRWHIIAPPSSPYRLSLH